MKQQIIHFIPLFLFIIYVLLERYNKISYHSFLENIIFISIILYYAHVNILLGIATFIFLMLYSFYSTYYLRKEGMNIYIDYSNDYDVDKLIKKSVIPLDIYQTWYSKNLPPKMRECVYELKRQNPEFKHHLYDDKECRDFIKNNFDKSVLNAYDNLIPGAYKADLWRYCILYKKGGIYLDIKFQCEKGFKLIELVDKEYLVLDRPYASFITLEDELKMLNDKYYYYHIINNLDSTFWENGEIGIYNAVMICKAGNPVLLKCIEQIVSNVEKHYYGYNPLAVSGPILLGKKYFANDYSKIKNFELFNSLNGDYIVNKKRIILTHYPEYRIEQNIYANKEYYHKMWHNKTIYKNKK